MLNSLNHLILTSFFVLFFSISAISQKNSGNISGKITGKSGMGLSDTHLSSLKTSDSVTTDKGGIFHLKSGAGDSIRVYNPVIRIEATFALPEYDSILITVKDKNILEIGKWNVTGGGLQDSSSSTIPSKNTARGADTTKPIDTSDAVPPPLAIPQLLEV